MAYDATELEGILEPPSITMRRPGWQRVLYRALNHLPGFDRDPERVTYEGRILSHREWSPWQRKIQSYWTEIEGLEADELEGGMPEQLDERWSAFVREYLLAIEMPLRAISYIEDLPYGPQVDVMKDFLGCQRRATEHGLEEETATRTEASGPAHVTSTPSGSKTRA